MISDFEKWKKDMLYYSKRENDNDEERFLRLVDQAEDCCTFEVAYVLMETFSDRPDYGTQERVISVLSTLSEEDFVTVILCSLPKLIKSAKEWAKSLMSGEIFNNFNIVQKIILKQNTDVKNSFLELLQDNDFISFVPEAKNLKITL